MASAFLASTTHTLRPHLAWSSGSSLWRFAYFRLLRHKQEKRETKDNGVLLLSLEGAHYHNQAECQFNRKGSMSSFSVGHSKDLVVASSKQEQKVTVKTSIQESIHETVRQPLLYPNAEECGNASVENVEAESFLSRSSQLVYRRRSRQNLIAGESLGAKNLDIEPKGSPLQRPRDESTTKDLGKPSRKRKETKRTSLHTVSQRATESQLTVEPFQQTEIDTVKNSGKKRVTAKTSPKTDIKTAEGSQKRRATAKIFECTEGETKTSQCREMAGSFEEKEGIESVSQGTGATGSEKHNLDAVIKIMEPWLLLAHKKVQPEWNVYDPLTMRRPNPQSSFLKLLSWNVNGLRALLKGKGGQEPGAAILQLAEKENFDILSLQETKLQEKDVLTIKEALLAGYDSSLWSCSTAKLGYSGTAVITRIKPLSVSYGLGIENHDNEGRVITVEFERFFLITCYVPNSGQKLERLAYRTEDWDISLGNYLKDLEKRKPVILTGDLNCAHQEIDIYNPDGNRRSAGFTEEERASFEKNFLHRGLTDTFRRQHRNIVGYTYWGYRTAARPKNQGWRLDYFLASDALLDLVHDSYILPDVEGSDHCPIGLTLRC